MREIEATIWYTLANGTCRDLIDKRIIRFDADKNTEFAELLLSLTHCKSKSEEIRSQIWTSRNSLKKVLLELKYRYSNYKANKLKRRLCKKLCGVLDRAKAGKHTVWLFDSHSESSFVTLQYTELSDLRDKIMRTNTDIYYYLVVVTT